MKLDVDEVVKIIGFGGVEHVISKRCDLVIYPVFVLLCLASDRTYI